MYVRSGGNQAPVTTTSRTSLTRAAACNLFWWRPPSSPHAALKVILHTDKKAERKTFSQVIINCLFLQMPCRRSGWHNSAVIQAVRWLCVAGGGICCCKVSFSRCRADKQNWLRLFRQRAPKWAIKLINNGWGRSWHFTKQTNVLK